MTDDNPTTVSHAAEHGSRRDLLEALRRRLAAALDDERTQPRDLSPITMRLRDIARELAEMDANELGADIDDAAKVPDEPFDPRSL